MDEIELALASFKRHVIDYRRTFAERNRDPKVLNDAFKTMIDRFCAKHGEEHRTWCENVAAQQLTLMEG